MGHPLPLSELKKYNTPIERPLKILRSADDLTTLEEPFIRPIAWWTDGEFEHYLIGVFGTNVHGIQHILDIPMNGLDDWEHNVAIAIEHLAATWPEKGGD